MEALRLDKQLCFRTYTASRLMIRFYKPILDELKLTYPQYVTMLVLWEQKSIGFRTLGQTLQMSTGTLTPIIQRLIKLDYVKKIKDPDDDRKAIVLLSEAGEGLLDVAKDIPSRIACALSLSEEEYLDYISTLDEFLEKLNNAEVK